MDVSFQCKSLLQIIWNLIIFEFSQKNTYLYNTLTTTYRSPSFLGGIYFHNVIARKEMIV